MKQLFQIIQSLIKEWSESEKEAETPVNSDGQFGQIQHDLDEIKKEIKKQNKTASLYFWWSLAFIVLVFGLGSGGNLMVNNFWGGLSMIVASLIVAIGLFIRAPKLPKS